MSNTPPFFAPKLSACLIVKNEAANLPRCLASLQGLVDEIVVVDTGSHDDTVAIAEAAGCKVGHFAWCDDFSAARNASLALATSDWLLVIDADEELVVTDSAAWRGLLADLQTHAYVIEVHNLDDDGRIASRITTDARCFRRDPRITFAGKLHESAAAAMASAGWTPVATDAAAIRHHGYSASALAAKDTVGRNLRLAQAMTDQAPDEAEGWYHVAAGHWLAGHPVETLTALAELDERLQRGAALAQAPRMSRRLLAAWAHRAAGDVAAALGSLDTGLAELPGCPEYLYDRGRLYVEQGETERAIADFAGCVAPEAPHVVGTTREGVRGYLSHSELMGLHLQAGRAAEAAHHAAAASADPNCPAAERSMLTRLASSWVAETLAPATDARAALLQDLRANPRDALAFLELALDCVQSEEPALALVALQQCINLDANQSAAYQLLGVTLSTLGQPQWAARAYGIVQQLSPDHPNATELRLACRGREASGPIDPMLAEQLESLFSRIRPTVTACLIVKNEAADLPRCLASLQGLVDEIVVVDTGSHDDTVAIAEAAGCKVGHFAWCDDFSAARNASFALATSDWLLVIDADEELIVTDHELWMELLRCRVPGAYALPLCNLDAHQVRLDRLPTIRLIQAGLGLTYRGRLHETVQADLDAQQLRAREALGVEILHYGYAAQAMQDRDKVERNVKLAEAALADNPHDGETWFNAARTYSLAGRTEEAIAAYIKTEQYFGGLEAMTEGLFVMVIDGLASLMIQKGRPRGVKDLLDRGLRRLPDHPQFVFLRGHFHKLVGERELAIADFQKCLTLPPDHYALSTRMGATDKLPRKALADLGAEAPPPDATPAERRAALLQRLAASPRDAHAFLDLAALCVPEGKLDQALVALQQCISLDANLSAAYELLGSTLSTLGQPAWAARAYGIVQQLSPDHPNAIEMRLSCRGREATGPIDPMLAEQLESLFSRIRPTVSACLIVKNEAANLPRCLASLQGLVDEIVVVDTGSHDDTVAIAEAAGCKVGHFAWCDDFSAARNASLALATSDWLLVIDADEELVVEDRDAWTRMLRCRVPGVYQATLVNVTPQGQATSAAAVVRLLQRDAGLAFAGRLHESVGESLAARGWPYRDTHAYQLRHHGYAVADAVTGPKAKRNLHLAELDIADRPDSPMAWLQLGRSLLVAGCVGEAIAAFERLQAIPGALSGLRDIEWALAIGAHQEALQRATRHGEAIALLTDALGRLPGHPEFLYERGRAYAALGDVVGARQDFEACLHAARHPSTLVERAGLRDSLPTEALAALAPEREPA